MQSQASADGATPAATNGKAKGKGKGKGKAKGKGKKGRSGAKFGFYKVVCKVCLLLGWLLHPFAVLSETCWQDNGVGMKHSAIPDMFGRGMGGGRSVVAPAVGLIRIVSASQFLLGPSMACDKQGGSLGLAQKWCEPRNPVTCTCALISLKLHVWHASALQALIWSRKSTGMPIEIKTAYGTWHPLVYSLHAYRGSFL